jgi:hypothetical protein
MGERSAARLKADACIVGPLAIGLEDLGSFYSLGTEQTLVSTVIFFLFDNEQ